MKILKPILQSISTLSFIMLIHTSCHDVKVGFLQSENAIYIPDSMVVKSALDPTEDAHRIQFQIPWQSTSIEGIQGTMPIRYSIRSIESDNGYTDANSQISVVRKGVFEIPWNHTLPSGKYIINLRISNEGYTHDLDSIYTIIIN